MSRSATSKRSAGWPERACKAVTVAAIALALPFQLFVDPASGQALRVVAWLGFLTSFACSRVWGTATMLVVVALGPILPALLTTIFKVAAFNAFASVWFAALFGALLPSMSWTRWQFPREWRIPLGIWGLILAVSWPVMVGRETAFDWAALRDPGTMSSWAGLDAPQVESWILHVVLAQLVALLWFEWQIKRNSVAGAHGIWIGTSIASLIALYQGTIDFTFLSGGPWPGMLRATGTFLDANAYGTMAAIAGPLAFVSIPHLRLRCGRVAQTAVLALNWAGAWMSGSRTALLCGAFASLLMAHGLLRSSRREGAARFVPAAVAGSAVLVLLLVVGVSAIGPVQRITDEFGASVSLRQLWSRGGYGSVATRMVRDHPLVGVGVGSYNWMASDYWRTLTGNTLPFDNAQNWWRHQVAELGLLGALPVLLWSLLLLWQVLSRRSPFEDRLETETLRGLLIGIGAASMVGMPTQNPIVLMTFFYVVARFDGLTRPEERPATSSRSSTSKSRRLEWMSGIALALVYMTAHEVLADGSLSPARRATRSRRDYVVGAYAPEPLSTGQFRWTRDRASFLLQAPTKYLVIHYRVDHPDVADRPVTLHMTTRCQPLLEELISDSSTGRMVLQLQDGQTFVEFFTEVSRTWRPADFEGSDTRDLGAAIETTFVEGPDDVDLPTKWIELRSCDSI